MRSFAALVAVATLPMIAADTCQAQHGGHTNAICCAPATFPISPTPDCDYENDANKCQTACCGTTCASRNVVCPADYVKKEKYDTTRSNDGDSAATVLAACCERTCKSMGTTCPMGKSKVAGFDALTCADKDACDDACCKVTCASTNIACTTMGLAPKAAYDTIVCPGGGCDEGDCCERTCKSSAIVCAAGTNEVEGFSTKTCASQDACEDECCKRTCASAPARTCTTPGLVQREKYATIECPVTKASTECSEDLCCVGTCKSKGVTCGDGYIKLGDFDTIECAGAADTCADTCCEKTCSHADHAKVCDAIGTRTFQLKKESATIACSTGRTTDKVVSKCDNELCCDLTRVARDVTTIRATLPHTLVSCVENADCRKHGDATATCDTKTNECTCTGCDLHNFKGKDTFGWENTRCYQKKETHVVALVFSKAKEMADICSSDTDTTPIPKDVRTAVLKVYESFTGGKVLSAEFLCSAESKVTASLKVELVKDAVLKTDEAAFNTLLNGQAADIKNKLGGALETQGRAGPCKRVTNVAEQLNVDGNCLTQRCNIGYYKHKASRVCTEYVAGTTAAADEFDVCLVDGDCTWRSHVGWCVEGKCVLNLDTYQSKLKKASGSDKDWCTDDASCTAFGDVNATCSKNVGLGNWCSCAGADYDYPAGDNIGLCVPTAATAIKFGYTVVYDTGLACPTTEAQVEGFTALIRKVLGDDAAKVAHRCAGTRVVFLGVASLTKALSVELASGGSSVFVDKLVAERAVGKAAAVTTVTQVAAADRDADALADPYAGLGNAVPTSATVGAPVACQKPFATSTVLYNTECIAMECLDTYAVIGVDCILITPTPNTTAPDTGAPPVVVASDDDSGLSNGEKAGLGIGITFGVLLIVGVIVAVVVFSKKSDEPAKVEENEPAADEPVAGDAAGDAAGETAV